MDRARPGDSADDSGRTVAIVLSLLVALAAIVSACGGSDATDEEDVGDASVEEVRDPGIGSNADLQAEGDAATTVVDSDDEVDDDEEESIVFEPAPSGYLVWAHPVEPLGLAITDQVEGGLFTTSWIREGLLEGLYRVDEERRYVPELLAADAAVTVNSNETVTIAYRLRSGLTWSDGEPLTAADVEFTHRVLMEGCLTEADGSAIDVSNEGCVYPMNDRTGYDLVTGFTVDDDTSFTVNMAAFYPDWRSLYGQVLAVHAFGEDAATVAANLETMSVGGSPLPSSGPFVFEDWSEHRMRLAVNDAYHGSAGGGGGAGGADSDADADEASIAGVQINFVTNADQAVAAVSAGDADLAVVPPTADLVSGGAGSGTAVTATPALEFDHLGLNLLNGHLADPLVRRAVAEAIGRDEVTEVYGPLRGDGIDPDGVGNVYWLPGQAGYEDHQPQAVSADPEAAAGLLTEAGYSRGSDGVFAHPDRGRLSLRLTTNAGDSIRVAIGEVVASQLTEAGFDIREQNRVGGVYLTEGPFAEAALDAAHSGGSDGDADLWDLVVFPWAGGPWPGLQSGAFRARSGANPYGYDNPEFDAESSRCDGLADDAERDACYQDLDAFVTTLDQGEDGLFVVPLVERPEVIVYRADRLAELPVVGDGPTGGPLVDPTGYRLSDG